MVSIYKKIKKTTSKPNLVVENYISSMFFRRCRFSALLSWTGVEVRVNHQQNDCAHECSHFLNRSSFGLMKHLSADRCFSSLSSPNFQANTLFTISIFLSLAHLLNRVHRHLFECATIQLIVDTPFTLCCAAILIDLFFPPTYFPVLFLFRELPDSFSKFYRLSIILTSLVMTTNAA